MRAIIEALASGATWLCDPIWLRALTVQLCFCECVSKKSSAEAGLSFFTKGVAAKREAFRYVDSQGVGTATAGLTDADEFAVLLSIPASDAASPVPLAAPDASPVLSAEANPSAKELAAAVLLVASVDPSESASICAVADTKPSPEEFADTSTVEDDDADAVPSSLVVEVLPVAVPEALIE
jgi:hypothetical protein